MLDSLAAQLALTSGQTLFALAIVFVAGVVRGFSGFALSALTIAGLVAVLPPVALIPVCFVLEGAASVVSVRGGLREADRGIVVGLVLGGFVGLPVGLAATRALDPDVSRVVALVLLICLALAQLLRVAPAWLATRSGLFGTGVAAGFATGIASIGGMVVALYMLARDLPAARMRASLVVFLCVGMGTSSFWLLTSGVMDALAFRRGLLLSPVVVTGVLLGARLFDPARQTLYRRVCLWLLVGLAATGLARQLA